MTFLLRCDGDDQEGWLAESLQRKSAMENRFQGLF
jgi:hypothetical protein